MKEVIMLGSDFMFNEELGSRLRGIGHTVYTFSSNDQLFLRLDDDSILVKLVILDINQPEFNISEIITSAKSKGIPVIAIGAHKGKELLQQALDQNADLVITNSQASKSIETFVNKVLKIE